MYMYSTCVPGSNPSSTVIVQINSCRLALLMYFIHHLNFEDWFSLLFPTFAEGGKAPNVDKLTGIQIKYVYLGIDQPNLITV